MIHSTLAETEELVAAAGLDLDALSLIVSEALDEDLGGRGVLPLGAGAGLDITSYATIPAGDTAHGAFVVRQPGTVAGLPVAAYTVASVCSAAGDFECRHPANSSSSYARIIRRFERALVHLLAAVQQPIAKIDEPVT